MNTASTTPARTFIHTLIQLLRASGSLELLLSVTLVATTTSSSASLSVTSFSQHRWPLALCPPQADSSAPSLFFFFETRCTTTKLLVRNTCLVPSLLISSPAPWTRSDQAHVVSSSDPTTLSLVSLVPATTGLRVTTPRSASRVYRSKSPTMADDVARPTLGCRIGRQRHGRRS